MGSCVLSPLKSYPKSYIKTYLPGTSPKQLYAACPHLMRERGEGQYLGMCMRNEDAPAPCISQLLKLNYALVRDTLTLLCPFTSLTEVVSLSEYVDEEEAWCP